jgi:hypothetical protein
MANEIEIEIDPALPPSGPGCVECLASGGWWFHLRRCARCGHVGCCDSSPSQHASRHAFDVRHPIVQSYEPEEDWFWDTRPSNTSRDQSWPHRTITPSTSLSRDRLAACPQGGSGFCTNAGLAAPSRRMIG